MKTDFFITCTDPEFFYREWGWLGFRRFLKFPGRRGGLRHIFGYFIHVYVNTVICILQRRSGPLWPPPPLPIHACINSILMLIKMHYWSHRSANHLLDFLSWPYYLLRINTCAIVKKVRYIYYRVMKRYFCC